MERVGRLKPLIELDRVEFAYPQEPDKHILKDVCLTIKQGEFVSIIGHNGSGKSTLAKHMNGLLLPTSGKVTINGLDTADQVNVWKVRQQVGMVFQNPDNQFVAPTVIDDVAFGLENIGLPREEMHDRIETALRQVSMQDYKDREPHRLSGGQKQRVAIAGVIAMRPHVIVFDESTAMLDPIGRKEVIETARALNQSGITIVLITHNLEEALFADRLIVMNKGMILREGTPSEVFSHIEELKTIGLDVPFTVELSQRLKKRGLPLDKDTIKSDRLVEQLWKLL
jgi:energy-coupling factor transport system ATP-binding protein